jgi:hypothetical protein
LTHTVISMSAHTCSACAATLHIRCNAVSDFLRLHRLLLADVSVDHSVGLALVTCGLVLVLNARRARRLRYSLKDFPATVPEVLLATVKAVAYG